MHYLFFSSEQYLFDRCLQALWFSMKLVFKLFIYSPMIISGYFIAIWLLHKDESAIVWVATILFIAYTLYLFLYFIKGMIIGFLIKRNFLWLPLFIISLAYTCVLPVWLSFEIIEKVSVLLAKQDTTVVAWMLTLAFFDYIYSRYHFLMDMAPASVYPIYKAGIHTALFLTKPKA
jgi:hypothetical protein